MELTRRRFIKNAGLITAGAVSSVFVTPGLLTNLAFGANQEKAEQEEEIAPAEDLMREHGILERLLLIYEESSHRLATSQDFSPEFITSAARINRDFIENYHEKLEEDYLFPRLQKAGKEIVLVNTLLNQHKAGRRLTDNILELSSPKVFQTLDHRKTLAHLLDQYIRMYRPHASREDTVLFPAFKEIVPDMEYKDLGERFEEKEHQLFGEDGFQKIVAQVAELEKSLA